MSSRNPISSDDVRSKYFSCISACEACVVACSACPDDISLADTAQADRMEASVCIQVCQLALHAMANQAAIVPAACSACARACEALARKCTQLRSAEYQWCARACYRAAQECRKLAAVLRKELAEATPPVEAAASAETSLSYQRVKAVNLRRPILARTAPMECALRDGSRRSWAVAWAAAPPWKALA